MSTQVLFIRHGESTWNAEGRIQGQAEPPLSELGRRQAAALGHRLSNLTIAALYTSSAARARETSEAIVEPHGLTPQIEPALLELNLGSWQGLRTQELSPEEALNYRAWEHDPNSASPPDGETIVESLNRVAPIIDRFIENHVDSTIVIVTHSIIGRVAISYLIDSGVRLVPRLRIKKASITKLRIENGFAVLERLSDTGHLRGV